MSALPKVLLLTSELFPEFGYPTAGGGVRAQQLFRSLQASGFPVELGLLRSVAEGKDLPEWATRYLYRTEFVDGLIESADPDIVLTESWEPLSHLRSDDQRVYIADCPGPLVLEQTASRNREQRAILHHKLRALSRADAVLVPNEPMRYYLSSFLSLAGWGPGQSDRIWNVPIALPDALPDRTLADDPDFRIFVGGVSWAWHDASRWLIRLADDLEDRGIGRIHLRQGKHPHHELEEGAFENWDKRIQTHPRIRISPLTGWEDLIVELTSMPLAIEWSPRNLEREIASTLRIVTYLWTGIPVIVRPHIALAEEISQYGAGWVLDDWNDMVQLIDDLSRDPVALRDRSLGARKLAAERHAWPGAHQALLESIAGLKPRPKSPSFLEHAATTFRAQEEELARLRADSKLVREEISRLHTTIREFQPDAESFRALRQKLPYRLWKKITG